MPPILPFGGLSFLIHLSILGVGWCRDVAASLRGAQWSRARIVRGFGTPKPGASPGRMRLMGWLFPALIAVPFLLTIGNIGIALTRLSGNTGAMLEALPQHLHAPAERQIAYPSCMETVQRLAFYRW